MEWWFYHLERSPVDEAIPPLLEKCLSRDWRVLVVSPDEQRLANLDKTLWTFSDASFLPHGIASGDFDHRQPVLLTRTDSNVNNANVVLLLDGADTEITQNRDRCMVMFEHNDEGARQQARAQYKRAKSTDNPVRYFRQTDGGGWTEQT